MLGVFICDECMLFNHAHHDVHTQQVQYIQDQCTIYNKKKSFYIGCLVLSDLHLTISLEALPTNIAKDRVTFSSIPCRM